jgi:cell division protease FtsH
MRGEEPPPPADWTDDDSSNGKGNNNRPRNVDVKPANTDKPVMTDPAGSH